MSLQIETQMRKLKRIRDGWRDGRGKAPKEKDLYRIQEILSEVVKGGGIELPHLYPMLNGGIRAEWRNKSGTVLLEFTLPEVLGMAPVGGGWYELDIIDHSLRCSIPDIKKWLRLALD